MLRRPADVKAPDNATPREFAIALPERKFPVAAVAAITFLAAALRLAYAWRLGVAPPLGPVVASAATSVALAAVAFRLVPSPLAAAAAAFAWAALPAAIVASAFFPAVTYASCAAAYALYLFGEGAGRRGATANLLGAGAFAGAAASLSSTALALAGFFLLSSVYHATRRGGGGARSLSWLGGFVAVAAAAAGLEYLRLGVPFAHLREALAAPLPAYAGVLLKRIGPDAAAMLFWDPLGFGLALVAALAAAAYHVGRRRPGSLFYASLLLFTLAAFNFMTTSGRGYAPMPLEPTLWLIAALPAAVLMGGLFGALWEEGEALGRWAGALGGAAILATLFINGNMYLAPLSLAWLWAVALATLGLAGTARRASEPARRRLARAAAAAVTLIFIYPTVILYL